MVELTYLALIGIALAAMFFGYGFGLFEGRSQGYKKRKKEEQLEKENQQPPKPEVVTETVTVDEPGLLRIKDEGGSYTLDLDGARVNPTALSPEQRKRLIEMLNVMRPWLEGRSAPAPSVTTSPPQSALLDRMQPKPAPPAPPAQTPPTPAPVQPAAPPPPAKSQPAAPRPATIAKEDRPAAPANSIVSQIDSILQARLAGTPLEERGVFLTQSPQGGVNVFVGLTRYEGVDEVPDPEVKAAIRAAITEWEQKYTPGL
jgi:hypothetical protein